MYMAGRDGNAICEGLLVYMSSVKRETSTTGATGDKGGAALARWPRCGTRDWRCVAKLVMSNAGGAHLRQREPRHDTADIRLPGCAEKGMRKEKRRGESPGVTCDDMPSASIHHHETWRRP